MRMNLAREASGRLRGRTDASSDIGPGTRSGSVVARADDGRCGVRIDDATYWAHPTAQCDAQPGDRVLVTQTEGGETYLLAQLGRPKDTGPLVTHSGVRAELVNEAEDEKLQVRDAAGALLFEYDAATGRSAVFAPEGDLSLNAPNGKIELTAAEGIACVSPGPVQLQSAVHVGLKSSAHPEDPGARLNLTGGNAALTGQRIVAVAGHGEMRIARLRFKGERFEATFEHAKMVYERIENVARQVVERFGRVDRRVEETDHRRAGRVVDQIDGDLHQTSEEATVRTRGTYRLDGEKIHIG